MSSNNSNQLSIPEAREAMDPFKMQAVGGVGVNLKKGYNGDQTSREASNISGQMVKKMWPVQTAEYMRNSRISAGYSIGITYHFSLQI